MSKNLSVILLMLITIVLSGCTGTDSSKIPIEVQKFDHANPNLDANIVDVKFDRNDIRAGETVISELFIANTGTEKIINETVEIKAKVISLNDTLANLYLRTMSEEKKTRVIPPINFNVEIAPGAVKTVSAVFHTIKEMEGKSLAGTYEITVTLSINGQKVEARIIPITLSSGEPRESTPAPATTPSPTPSPTLTSTPTSTLSPIYTPVPTSTPEIVVTIIPTPPVVAATPTGKVRYTRVRSDKFTEPFIQINAGDMVIWDNYDVLTSLTYTIAEQNGKIANITLPEARKANYTFNVTGDYRFALYYQNMHGKEPSTQTISVRVNASQ